MNMLISLPLHEFYKCQILILNYIIISIILLQSCSSQKKGGTLTYLRSQEIEIKVDAEIFISGTLSYVNSESLIIMIAGSGPTDRDCNNNIGLQTDAFKMLAKHLDTIGVSSFRFDKRGIGKSSKVSESTMTMDLFTQDVHTIIDHFKNDFTEIILLGHSEGVLIGSMVAKENLNVSSFIAIAGVSNSMDEVILDQLAKFPKLVPMAEKHIEEIKSGKELSEVNVMLASLFRPSVVPFLQSAFILDPAEEFSLVKQAILILNGVCDIQVPVNHAEKLHENNSNSELVIIENMGHVLKELEDDCSNLQVAYKDPTLVLNSKMKDALTAFLNK